VLVCFRAHYLVIGRIRDDSDTALLGEGVKFAHSVIPEQRTAHDMPLVRRLEFRALGRKVWNQSLVSRARIEGVEGPDRDYVETWPIFRWHLPSLS